MSGWGWGMAVGMGLWTLIGIALLLLLVAAIVRMVAPTAPEFKSTLPPSDPESILDERYARGEIDDDEYARRRQLLSAKTAPTRSRRR